MAVSKAVTVKPADDKRLLVVDTDFGCDDALALLLAMRDPNVELIAVTTVFGNVTLEQAIGTLFTDTAAVQLAYCAAVRVSDNARTMLPVFASTHGGNEGSTASQS